ncbi:MAG: gamma-glutamyltransferase, partial [Mesorhizobium sp.]
RYAEQGYVVQDRVAFDWAESAALLAADEHAARIFLPDGRAPQAGELHRQPQLAETLRVVSRRGRAGFYEGEVADDMVARLRALGGLHALEDFAATQGEYVRPVGTSYRGYDIHQMPPNNQGLTALIMLNVLSGCSLGSLEPNGAERFHLEIEAGRLAYQDRDNFIGDQNHVHVPV